MQKILTHFSRNFAKIAKEIKSLNSRYYCPLEGIITLEFFQDWLILRFHIKTYISLWNQIEIPNGNLDFGAKLANIVGILPNLLPIVFLFWEKVVPKIDLNLLSRKIAEKIQLIKDPDSDFTLQINFWWHLFVQSQSRLLGTNTTRISAYVQCTLNAYLNFNCKNDAQSPNYIWNRSVTAPIWTFRSAEFCPKWVKIC